MNWFTLVALSAAGAAGSADVSDSGGTPTVAAVAEAAETDTKGVVVTRASGGLLQVEMVGVHLVIRSLDAEKKPVAMDAERATVRLQFAARSQEQYVLTRSADGLSLTSGKPIRPPHVFRATILLFGGESDEPLEAPLQVAYP